MSHKTDNITHTRVKRLPFMVKLVVFSLMVVMGMGWLRIIYGLINLSFLDMITISPYKKIVVLINGLLWALIPLPSLIGIGQKAKWATSITLPSILLILSIYWMERIFLWVNPESSINTLFMVIISILWVTFCFLAFLLSNHSFDKNK
jgi:hypothetical protein